MVTKTKLTNNSEINQGIFTLKKILIFVCIIVIILLFIIFILYNNLKYEKNKNIYNSDQNLTLCPSAYPIYNSDLQKCQNSQGDYSCPKGYIYDSNAQTPNGCIKVGNTGTGGSN